MAFLLKHGPSKRFSLRAFRLVGSLICTLFVFAVVGLPACAEVGDWFSYTNANFIQDLHVLEEGLWCATSGGILNLNTQNSAIRKFTNVDGLSHVDVLTMSLDRRQKLWFGTNGGGVSRYDHVDDLWKIYTEFDGVAGNVIGSILATDSRIWVGTQSGISLFVWNEQEGDYFWKENYLSERRVPVKKVHALLYYNDAVWLGMDGGVARARYRHPDFVPNLQDSASWTNYDQSNGLTDNQINCLVLVDSTIWAGTNDGVSTFQESSWTALNEGLPANTMVFDLLVSGAEVWAGTSEGIYIYLSKKGTAGAWSSVREGEAIRALAIDAHGKLWAGSEYLGVLELVGEEWLRHLTEAPADNNIERVALDRQEHVWVTTVAPGWISTACRLADDGWTIFEESDGLQTSNRLLGLLIDQLGRIWFGSWGGGISVLDDTGTLGKEDDVWLHFDEENSGLTGISQNPQYVVVTDIAQDQQGNFWFANFSGVESGLVVCDPTLSQWTAYSVRDGLVFPEVISLAIDKQGIKWVGALQEGMSRFDDSGTPFDKGDDDPIFAWQTYSESSSDPALVITSDNVSSISIDKEGIVWIGTAGGVMEYTGFYFSSAEGLANASVNVVTADARNNIWIGTAGGVSVLMSDGSGWVDYTTANSGLVSNVVQDIAINQLTGEVWLATDLGLSRFESGIIPSIVSMDQVWANPNPYYPEMGNDLLTFQGLADGSIVHIYDLSGQLLRKIPMPANNLNRASWDGRNEQGKPAASGIYVFVVSNQAGETKAGKIALVR